MFKLGSNRTEGDHPNVALASTDTQGDVEKDGGPSAETTLVQSVVTWQVRVIGVILLRTLRARIPWPFDLPRQTYT